jgi:nitronate monooxygenase
LVAAGGIADAATARAAMVAGADVVSLGTAFAASVESLAHPRYRERLIAAEAADTELTDLYDIGWAAQHRVLDTHVSEAWRAAGCPPSGSRPGEGEIVARAAAGPIVRYSMVPAVVGTAGDIDAMALYAGCGVGSVRAVEPASAIVERIAGAMTS